MSEQVLQMAHDDDTILDIKNLTVHFVTEEETVEAVNDISKQYGDNVIVEFSGDGMAALADHKQLHDLPESHKEIPDWMLTQHEDPKNLTKEELAEMQGNKEGTDMEAVMRQMDPNAYKEYQNAKADGMEKGGTEGITAGFRYMYNWVTSNAKNDSHWMDSYDPDKKQEADFEIELTDKLNTVKAGRVTDDNKKAFYSVEDSADDLLKAYASLVDEIVKGHEDGTRKSYVKDKDGLREMTMQEELDALDKAFEKLTERSEKRLKNRDAEAAALEKYSNQLSGINSSKEDIPDETKEWIEKVKKDPVPTDYKEKLISAAKMFTEQFKANRGLGIGAILEGISIFGKG